IHWFGQRRHMIEVAVDCSLPAVVVIAVGQFPCEDQQGEVLRRRFWRQWQRHPRIITGRTRQLLPSSVKCDQEPIAVALNLRDRRWEYQRDVLAGLVPT